MRIAQTIRIMGERFVIIPQDEYRRLKGEFADKDREAWMPPLPVTDHAGNMPAVDFARASIARSIIQERRELGLTQQELARLAGVRQETVSRLESGKHSPTVRTVEKIDRALKKAAKRLARRK